ncbi:hypothetical protein CEUSTIGMA_g13752.t1 [Chlamydomonas eustigma]|uniref:Uncharacterized protein n=1 Tax=Chlamydomonas eustigma TaxID=1157962 RepID=A0A250XU60_9CHLO|nr:hypothetical protein CEUSTIGMA_g13752.t1 [Chlamydomonas eustigma]|eukprot:GAX86340.1 hypothetical protein CEUSTIGMA_g13752.t1 [Chlamydomonas eustigma]
MKVSSLTENYEPIHRMAQKTEKLRQELRKMSKAGHKKPSLSVDVDDGQALSGGSSPTPCVRRASETNGNMADLGATLNGPGRRLVSTRASRHSINSDDDDEGGVQTMRAGVGNSVNGASKAMGGFSGVSKFAAGTIKSPSMFNRKSSMNTGSPTKWGSSMGSGSLAQMDQQQSYIQRIYNLEEEVVKWKDRVKDLVADGEKRQASYMRREDELQHKVDQQREELDVMSGKRPTAISEEAERLRKTTIGPTTIQDLHGQVISGIEVLLRKQEVALKHGEATSIRHFKDKLAEVEAQVAAERAALSHINDDWHKKTVAMRNDLESTQAIATKLDQMYKLSEEECLRLKAQYK